MSPLMVFIAQDNKHTATIILLLLPYTPDIHTYYIHGVQEKYCFSQQFCHNFPLRPWSSAIGRSELTLNSRGLDNFEDFVRPFEIKTETI